jgi:hypothetical protein
MGFGLGSKHNLLLCILENRFGREAQDYAETSKTNPDLGSSAKRDYRMVGIPQIPHDDKTTRYYILDTKALSCYAFFMLFFLPAATFLMCFTTFGWNMCFMSSSLVISLGCFFFFMVTR